MRISIDEATQKTLTAFGGDRLAKYNLDDFWLSVIADRGRPCLFTMKTLRERTQRAAHENSARMWLEAPKKRRVFTGFALSDDGCWRRHSWDMEGGLLIETTLEREAYYGVELTPEEACQFAMELVRPEDLNFLSPDEQEYVFALMRKILDTHDSQLAT